MFNIVELIMFYCQLYFIFFKVLCFGPNKFQQEQKRGQLFMASLAHMTMFNTGHIEFPYCAT